MDGQTCCSSKVESLHPGSCPFIFFLQSHQATKAKNEELLAEIAETFPEGSAMKRLLNQGEALQDIAIQVQELYPAKN